MHVLLWRARRGQLGGEWDVERVRESPEDAAGRSALTYTSCSVWLGGGRRPSGCQPPFLGRDSPSFHIPIAVWRTEAGRQFCSAKLTPCGRNEWIFLTFLTCIGRLHAGWTCTVAVVRARALGRREFGRCSDSPERLSSSSGEPLPTSRCYCAGGRIVNQTCRLLRLRFFEESFATPHAQRRSSH
jgi:hypothetical protein